MTIKILATIGIALAVLSNYNESPTTPANAQAKLTALGHSTEATIATAKTTAESVKQPLTTLGVKVKETTEDTKSNLTKIGEFAQEGTRQTASVLTTIGELVQEATGSSEEKPSQASRE